MRSPSGAQIVSLADVYDALSCKRVYKDAFPREQVLEMIRCWSLRHFQPQTAGPLLRRGGANCLTLYQNRECRRYTMDQMQKEAFRRSRCRHRQRLGALPGQRGPACAAFMQNSWRTPTTPKLPDRPGCPGSGRRLFSRSPHAQRSMRQFVDDSPLPPVCPPGGKSAGRRLGYGRPADGARSPVPTAR